MRKKFLYIAYFYPPISAIASMRSWKLVKYIREYGWDPIVLAADTDDREWRTPLPEVPVYRVDGTPFLGRLTQKIKRKTNPQSKDVNGVGKKCSGMFFSGVLFRGARFLKGCLNEVFAYPDVYRRWQKNALHAARQIVVERDIDLILSTSGPYSSHIVASKLHRETMIPWIADYRDLWTQNGYEEHLCLRLFFERKLERLALTSAAEVVTVSEPLAKRLGSFLGKNVSVITNGFDPDDYESRASVENNSVFSVVYTGMLYAKKRQPEIFFQAVKNLLDNKIIDQRRFEIHFYGADKRLLRNLIEENKLGEIVRVHEKIPLEESIRKQKNATVLLFLNWNDPAEKGFFSGKIFEYLGARRPILSVPENPGSVVDTLLEKTGAGLSCSTTKETVAVIKKWYDNFINTGSVPYEGKEYEIEKYSRRNQAKEFAYIFDKVIS